MPSLYTRWFFVKSSSERIKVQEDPKLRKYVEKLRKSNLILDCWMVLPEIKQLYNDYNIHKDLMVYTPNAIFDILALNTTAPMPFKRFLKFSFLNKEDMVLFKLIYGGKEIGSEGSEE